jgi:hypothetical protein
VEVPRSTLVSCLILSLALTSSTAAATTPARTTPTLADPPACRDALDAVVDEARECRSPGALPPGGIVADDDPAPAEAPLREPALFAGELGFFAVVSTAIGAGAMVTSGFIGPRTTSPGTITLQEGAWWGGASLVSLGAGLGAAAVSMWVFDVSTGTLRWPIFAGEDT